MCLAWQWVVFVLTKQVGCKYRVDLHGGGQLDSKGMTFLSYDWVWPNHLMVQFLAGSVCFPVTGRDVNQVANLKVHFPAVLVYIPLFLSLSFLEESFGHCPGVMHACS